ncbi:MAG: response regulator [Leptospiraceae bacterium]|nr:response regulator [Leptospiraceae bacterium]MCP5512556.1 response regulator [Leptospiraceae bacterium]
MTDLEKVNILIVDDSEDNRLILEELIKSLSYESCEVENGKKALELLQTDYSPTIILLDINMPEMDGIELLKIIKRDENLKRIPVLMVSAIDETSEVVKCLQYGADDFIHKPFEVEILKARLENSLAKLRAFAIEKELLEKTFVGSVKILSNILSLLSPKIFGKAAKIQRYAKLIAEEISYPSIWEIEIAGLFSLVGTIALPPDLMDKIINGKSLLSEESKLFNTHPQIGFKLLNNIPRLENVAEIIKYQLHPVLTDETIVHKDQVPVGSKILHAAMDLDSIASKVGNPMEFMNLLKTKSGTMESHIYNAVEKVAIQDFQKEIVSLKISQIKVGMVFAEEVFTVTNAKVIGQWQEVTEAFLERLTLIHTKIGIKEPIHIYKPPAH